MTDFDTARKELVKDLNSGEFPLFASHFFYSEQTEQDFSLEDFHYIIYNKLNGTYNEISQEFDEPEITQEEILDKLIIFFNIHELYSKEKLFIQYV